MTFRGRPVNNLFRKKVVAGLEKVQLSKEDPDAGTFLIFPGQNGLPGKAVSSRLPLKGTFFH